ncbi:oxidase subunit 6B [Seminavis robusta]|uniref:Oxidase subunit 6B n=1 Tax=Seminavis robusta TaxID=568900 RepID=A0A9N8DWU0_9STRA|nr:oxidase subunit 6B [Seminavis robusta]|eukprot:Sro341_g121360.1 oxidase subunit 6B (108) ;mRNA; r:12389-12817
MAEPKISKIFSAAPPEMNKEQGAILSMVKQVRTAPRDERFPAQNQALHCWNRYNEWLLCTKQSDEAKCAPLRQYANAICPDAWSEQWDEERESGAFSGIGHRFNSKH